jgi:hypothetical protein
MAIRTFNVMQGTDEWLELRRGVLTASEMKCVITEKTLKIADNDKTRQHLYELAAQRISGYVEPHYVSDDMLRGQEDEYYAREAYAEHFAPVETVGFITNDKWGFTLGYSPDFLVGSDGQGECKSRRQKYQIETIINDAMPSEFSIQVQTGLLVTERAWCDFISYSGGLPMFVKRIFPDAAMQAAIVAAARDFHAKLDAKIAEYRDRLAAMPKLINTERIVREEILI